MPEMHLKQPGFTYSTCGPCTKNKERVQKFKETGDTCYIYKDELDKACSHHDMAYGGFKDLVRRTAPDKVSKRACFYGYKLFDKKSKASGVNMPLELNKKLAEELHKPIIRNF